MACDGVFDVMSNGQCCDTTRQLLATGEQDMAAVCEELIDLALDGGSTDNISAVVSSTYTPRSLLFTRAWLCTGGLFRFLRDCIACVGTVQVVQLPGAKVYEGVGEGLSGRRVARGTAGARRRTQRRLSGRRI